MIRVPGRAVALAVRAPAQRALAEVDQGFRFWVGLDPPKRRLDHSTEAAAGSLHRLVTPGGNVLNLEILTDIVHGSAVMGARKSAVLFVSNAQYVDEVVAGNANSVLELIDFQEHALSEP